MSESICYDSNTELTVGEIVELSHGSEVLSMVLLFCISLHDPLCWG